MRKVMIMILIFAVSIMLVSCMRTPLSENQRDYAGVWKSGDGTKLQIFFDGGANFEGSNLSISGGAVSITDKELIIKMMFEKKFTITKPPALVNGEWVMELDGIQFAKKEY
jgi:hypothetical protein